MKNCNQCGKCCIKYADGGLSATPDEIKIWKIFQPHIHQYVRDGKIWVDPNTGKQLSYCPFLEKTPNADNSLQKEKYTCSIYLDRPEDCRLYPSNISEMVRDECEMVEAVDLKNLKRAQIKLDVLMSDSRSANS